MPVISVMMKPSSGMCNMSCDYCFYRDEAQKRCCESYGFMSEQTLRNIIKKTLVNAEYSATYAFQGGEPTLRGLDFYRKVIEYEQKYNCNHVQINNVIQTNGLLLDDEWCRFLADNHFLVGASVDGIPETHDKYRHDRSGGPTFNRIFENIRLLEKYGVDYNILTVVNNTVAEHISEIYSFYRQNNWTYQQYIACLDPLNEERGKEQYTLTPKAYGQFLTELFDLWYKDWENGRQPYIRQFENYIGILAGYMPEACNQRGRCSVQNVIEADGSVYPCDFYMLDEFRLGNYNENLFKEIAENGRKSGFVERSLDIDSKCKTCKYYAVCRGGCQRERDRNMESGRYLNYFCEGYQYFFDNCLERMKGIVGGQKEGS